MTLRNFVLSNNNQEPVFWCIIKKGVVQEPFANHRVGVSVRKLMKSNLVSPSAVWIEIDSIYSAWFSLGNWGFNVVTLRYKSGVTKGLLNDTSEFVYKESNIKRVRNLANWLKWIISTYCKHTRNYMWLKNLPEHNRASNQNLKATTLIQWLAMIPQDNTM